MRHSGPVTALARAAARIYAVTDVISLNALLLTHQGLYAFASYDEEVCAATARTPTRTCCASAPTTTR